MHNAPQDFEALWNRHRGDLALEDIARELNALRMALRDEAHCAEQDIAIAEVALAEAAALGSDGARMLEHLYGVGRWTLDQADMRYAALAAAAIRLSWQS